MGIDRLTGCNTGRRDAPLLGDSVVLRERAEGPAGRGQNMHSNRSKRRSAILTKLGYTRGWAIRFNYLETFLLEPKTTPRRHQPNSASPQRGRSGVSGARCAERASEAGARGRTNKNKRAFDNSDSVRERRQAL